MRILGRHISKGISLVFLTTACVVFALVVAVQWVDLMTHADQVLMSSSQLLVLLGYRLPGLWPLVAPLVLGMSLIIYFDRASESKEMIAWTSLGLSPWRLLRMSMPLIAFLTLLSSLCVMFWAPRAAQAEAQFLRHHLSDMTLDILPIHQFFSLGQSGWVAYIESRDGPQTGPVFMVRQHGGADIITAQSLSLESRGRAKGIEVALHQGERLQWQHGGRLRLVRFKAMRHAWTPKASEHLAPANQLTMKALYRRREQSHTHEVLWQWRLAVPIMLVCVASLVIGLWEPHDRYGRRYMLCLLMVLFMYVACVMQVHAWSQSDPGHVAWAPWLVHGLLLLGIGWMRCLRYGWRFLPW